MKSILVAGALIALAGGAEAGVVYNNPGLVPGYGDCSFSTVCAATYGRGDDFAAQAFTLSHDDVLTGGGFTELDHGTGPYAVTWGIIAADGPGGSPGTILASGTDSISSVNYLGTDGYYSYNQELFDLGNVGLSAGNYYFAVQGLTTSLTNYLDQGANNTGAFETMDGGVTWTPTYEGIGGVSVILFDGSAGVPEPATWALMLVGFAGLGGALRRRAKATA